MVYFLFAHYKSYANIADLVYSKKAQTKPGRLCKKHPHWHPKCLYIEPTAVHAECVE